MIRSAGAVLAELPLVWLRAAQKLDTAIVFAWKVILFSMDQLVYLHVVSRVRVSTVPRGWVIPEHPFREVTRFVR